jgi:P pilus assembly chaperone PapD
MIPSGSNDGTGDDNPLWISGGPQASQATATAENVTWLITWETNMPASSQVEYDVEDTSGSTGSPSLSPLDSALVKSHTVTLSGLAPSATYYYSVISIDEAGNKADSDYGNSFRTSIQFALVSSEVTMARGEYGNTNAALRIRFTASDAVYFKLTDPDGMLAGTGSAERGVTGAVLAMAGNCETPKAGTYTLLVDASDGYQTEQIATQDFDYQGANASVSDLIGTWTVLTGSPDYATSNLSFKVSNAGDLPVCISYGECSLGGSPATLSVSGTILPGETKAFSASSSGSIAGISAGQKTFTLTLKDSQGMAVATYTADCQGANASVSDLSLNWTFSTYSQDYALDGFSFKVSNTGDLPVYISQGECSLGGSLVTLTLSEPGTVLPGGTKTFSAWSSYSGVSAGQKTFILTLKDSQGAVVATYTGNVTPA